MSTTFRFLLVFALVSITQTYIWEHKQFYDQHLWERRLEKLAPSELTSEAITEKQFSSTPGTLTLLVGKPLLLMGIPTDTSLRISVTLLVSLAVASTTCIAYALLPATWWWIAVAILMSAHPLFQHNTPVDAVVTPLLGLFIMACTWYVSYPLKTSFLSDMGMALVAAGALATRLHTAVLIITPALLLLCFYIPYKRVGVLLGSALAIMIALNPFLGYIPKTYLATGVFSHTVTYAEQRSEGTPVLPLNRIFFVRYRSVFLFTSLAIISVFLSIFSYFTPQRILPAALPNLLYISTFSIVIILFANSLALPRYLFPVILIWEMFLPVFFRQLLQTLPRLQTLSDTRQHLLLNIAMLLPVLTVANILTM